MAIVLNKQIFFIVIILCLKPFEAVIQNIKIGAIFHVGDEIFESVFDKALEELKKDEPNIYFNLVPIKKTNVELESFKVVKVLCELVEEGVAVVFGPKYRFTRDVVSNVLEGFEIPHIEYSYRQSDPDGLLTKSINLYPGNTLMEKAIAEIVRHMKWQAFTFIYQTYDALSRIPETLENEGRPNYAINIRELMPLSEIKALPTEKMQNMVYESLVKELKLSSQLSLLLDVESENLVKLIETMNEMHLMTDYFICLIANLDSTPELTKYIAKSSAANVTQFRFIKDNRLDYTVEQALLYDAVFAFNEALITLFKDVSILDEKERNKINIIPTPLKCQIGTRRRRNDTYSAGLNIRSTFLKRIKMGKMTGLISFNEDGERDFEFDVMNTQAGKTNKVGEWKDGGLQVHRDEKQLNASLAEMMHSKIFKVTTRLGPPYVMLTEVAGPGTKTINGKFYEGYCIDLFIKIEEILDINCEFELVPDGNYGSYDSRTKSWNGLIKRLLELKADFAICDLTITSERQSAVDFTAPFMNLGISILFSKAEKVVPELFSFMSPLSAEVWIYMMTAYLVVSLMLFFQARIAPGEWINPHPCNPDPDELENSFTLMNSFWLTMGSLMQQGCDILPRAPSIRMVAGMWWFFVLIIVASYTANLAAFLTAVKMDDSIDNVEDLAKQTKISYGAVKGGSTLSFFKNSNTSTYQRIYNAMADAKPSVFTKTNDEGVERVIKGKRKYAFFMESTGIDYQIERHCELQQVGTLLDNKGYGIAMPPNSPYRTHISTAVLQLQEKGELTQLKQKWWKEKGGGKCDAESDEPANSNELGMGNVGGVFLVLIFGCLFSLFIGIVEFLWNIRTVAIEEKITPKEALIQELKFVIDVRATTKPVKTAKSSSKSTSLRKSSTSLQKSSTSLRKSSNSICGSTRSSLNNPKDRSNESKSSEQQKAETVETV